MLQEALEGLGVPLNQAAYRPTHKAWRDQLCARAQLGRKWTAITTHICMTGPGASMLMCISKISTSIQHGRPPAHEGR